MAVYNILPKVNLRDIDASDTLNEHGGVTDNVFGSKFRRTANVNKWSKRKPTNYRGMLFEKGDEEPAQWQGDDGMCGFDKSSVIFNVVEDLVSACMANWNYRYVYPEGGEEYPFRIGDYRGYYPKAISPILSFDYYGQIDANDNGSSMTFRVMGNGDVNEEVNLTMKDFLYNGTTSAEQMLLCVIITDTSGERILEKVGSAIGSDKNFVSEVSVSQTELGKAGSYLAFAALYNAQPKRYMAFPIGYTEFRVLNSVDAEKLGWVFGSGSITYDGSGRYTYTGQLSYSPTFEGANVFIELQINSVNTGKGETVQLVKQSQSADGKMHYMTYSGTARIQHTERNVYILRCGYGNEFLNNAYLDLGNVQFVEPTSNEEG